MILRTLCLLCLFTFSVIFSQPQQNSNGVAEFVLGGDASMLQQVENGGGTYRENGIPGDPLEMFRNHGMNYVRLKIWHTPTGGWNGLEKVKETALRAKNLGFKILLDFHYSDTWADPGQQAKPVAWSNAGYEALKDSIYQYTYSVIAALKGHNTLPDIVQLGNEIICGMLWNTGNVCASYNTPTQWARLGGLLNESIRGVNDNLTAGEEVRIMIHIANGGDNSGSRWFFDNLLAQNVDFDIIGQSYYPWWHGTLSDLSFNLGDLAIRYGKDIMVVETAYPWTLGWNDNTHNQIGLTSQLHSGYPATVEGQKAFLEDVINIVRQVPFERGIGVVYWAPDWVVAPQFGSTWENLALFDFSNNLLPSIAAFDTVTTDISPSASVPQEFVLHPNFPNPFNGGTVIKYDLPRQAQVTVKIFNAMGQQIRTLRNEAQLPGRYSLSWDGRHEDGSALGSGIYIISLQAGEARQWQKAILLK